MPSPPFSHGLGNDVFVSYAHADNEPDPNGRCWVSEFAADLTRRLTQVSGRSIRIWRDDRLGSADLLDREIQSQIASTGVLVPILSPSYLNSGPCAQEREAFVLASRHGAGLTLGNKSRIVKVAKTPVDRASYPAEFRELLEHRFYVELPNGEAREFLLHEEEEVRRRYAGRVDDVAREIAQILGMLERGTAAPASGTRVYLAETTSDLDDARDQIRRALEQRGCEVLPARTLPAQAPRLLALVASELARSKLTVHPVGSFFGVIPEQSDGKSIVQLQLESAAMAGSSQGDTASRGGIGMAPGPARVIWIPEGLKTTDASQQAFIDQLRRHYPTLGFELIESTVQKLETHLRDRLEARAPKPALITAASDRPLRVYVMCDVRDRDAARAVRKSLLARGIEVDFPPETGEPGEVRELHQERLREDEAFVIFYGQSPDVWVQRQLGELRKAAGLGRRAPIVARRVFLAEPRTSDKDDLLANTALVLDGLRGAPDEALQPLLQQLTDAASSPGSATGGLAS